MPTYMRYVISALVATLHLDATCYSRRSQCKTIIKAYICSGTYSWKKHTLSKSAMTLPCLGQQKISRDLQIHTKQIFSMLCRIWQPSEVTISIYKTHPSLWIRSECRRSTAILFEKKRKWPKRHYWFYTQEGAKHSFNEQIQDGHPKNIYKLYNLIVFSIQYSYDSYSYSYSF